MINQAFTTIITIVLAILFLLVGFGVSSAQAGNFGPSVPVAPAPGVGGDTPLGFDPVGFYGPSRALPYTLGDPVEYDRITATPDPSAPVLGTPVETTVAETPPVVDFANPIYQFLFEFVLNVFGTLFAFAGALMSFGINEFMLGFGDKYLNWNIGVAVEETWRIVRDLFNLTFIFGLVYIGFKMILDSSDSRAHSMLVSLIGAALLVNFSLFITKFIIDLSHVAAQVVADGFGSAQDNIANAFINILDLETTLLVSQGQINAFSDGGALAYIFGLMIFLAVATFVFAAGGILLIIRFIALNVYMVFSPVMFLGWVFPAFSGTSSKYWKGFLRQAFFAPAYLLMLYLSFKVLYAYRLRPGENSYAAMFSEDAAVRQSALEILPFFIMAMVFLVMSLVVARNMGSVGASTAISVGNRLRGNAQVAMGAATIGLAARAGRNTVGAGANKLSESKTFKDFTARNGRVGRALYNTSTAVADSSFDARKVGGVGKTLGIGEGRKGGFATTVKEQGAADEKFMKDLGTRDADTYDPETKFYKDLLDKYNNELDTEKDPTKRASILATIAGTEKSYNKAKSLYSAQEEYSRQLSYIKSVEDWKKKQVAVTAFAGAATAGAAATILSGGILPVAAAAAAGGGLGAGVGLANRAHNSETIDEMRKNYGMNGLKKRKKSNEESSIKKLAAQIADQGSKKTEEKAAPEASSAKNDADH